MQSNVIYNISIQDYFNFGFFVIDRLIEQQSNVQSLRD